MLYRTTLHKWTSACESSYRFNWLRNNAIRAKVASCGGSDSEHRPSVVDQLTFLRIHPDTIFEIWISQIMSEVFSFKIYRINILWCTVQGVWTLFRPEKQNHLFLQSQSQNFSVFTITVTVHIRDFDLQLSLTFAKIKNLKTWNRKWILHCLLRGEAKSYSTWRHVSSLNL